MADQPTNEATARCLFHPLFERVQGWMTGVLALLILAGCTTALTGPPKALGLQPRHLPLGSDDSLQSWNSREVSPGFWFHQVAIGPRVNQKARFALASLPLRTERDFAAAYRCDGGGAPIGYEQVTYREIGDPNKSYTVLRQGSYPTSLEAKAALAKLGLSACGFRIQPLYATPSYRNGPWQINILEIRPDEFDGRMELALASGKVAGREPTSKIANRPGVLAAVNTSFFVMREKDGLVGEPAGLAISNGDLVSEPTNARRALVIHNGDRVSAQLLQPKTPLLLRWDDGSQTAIDGVNRLPGKIRNCGNTGDEPTDRALHDVTCFDPDELIVLTQAAGFMADTTDGRHYRLGSDGIVKPAHPSDEIGDQEVMIIATGHHADDMESARRQGLRARLNIESVLSELSDHQLTDGIQAFNGAPTLVLNGVAQHTEEEEGWPLLPDLTADRNREIHGWINLRNPRTAAGILPNGTILFVTIDGRRPGISVGATIEELRGLMMALGSRDAINLDGGGSTTLVVEGQVVNSPSDVSGERAVSDALLIVSPLSTANDQAFRAPH